MTDKHEQCQLNTRCILPDGHDGRCVFRVEDEAALRRFFKELAEIERRDEETRQRDETIFDMFLACHTQQEIADVVGVEQNTVSEKIADFIENNQMTDSDIFRNFAPELYTLWNFQKLTNKVKVFGKVNEIANNLQSNQMSDLQIFRNFAPELWQSPIERVMCFPGKRT